MVSREVFSSVPMERAGPMTAFDLQALYLDDVLRYVSSFIRPIADAEDVTMEVFQAAFLNLSKLKRRDDPRVWLLGVARRKVADALRIRYRRREAPLADAAGLSQEDRARIEEAAVVRQLLDEMPRDQSEALVLKYVNGLSLKEVGQILGRSETAANSLLQRARETFYAKGAPLFLGKGEFHV